MKFCGWVAPTNSQLVQAWLGRWRQWAPRRVFSGASLPTPHCTYKANVCTLKVHVKSHGHCSWAFLGGREQQEPQLGSSITASASSPMWLARVPAARSRKGKRQASAVTAVRGTGRDLLFGGDLQEPPTLYSSLLSVLGSYQSCGLKGRSWLHGMGQEARLQGKALFP